MDPAAIGHRKQPDDEGYVFVDGSRLHYELYRPSGGYSSDSSNSSSSCGSQTNKAPLLMVMGAFATKVHFADMAKYLADTSGHEVLIYDHRGVGRSSNPRLEAQTAAQLAADSLVVADTIWGASTPIHVYGASMGGMVAQELALLLLPQHRLLSLSLSITCRGMQPMHGLLSPILTPTVIKNFFELWFWDSKPKLVRRLMRLLLTRQLMESLHPSGETYGKVYYKAWLEHFDELWTLNNHAAGACHAHVCLHHHLTDKQIATIRDSGVPIVCQVSTHDNLIPAAMQYELADKLRARTVIIPTGHLGFLPWKGRFYNMLLEQLAMGEAVRGIKATERERRSRAAAALAPTLGSAPSLLASFTKPLLSAFSGASSSSYFISAATGASSAGVTPEPSLDLSEHGGSQAGDAEVAAAGDVTDMAVDITDSVTEGPAGGKGPAGSVLAAIMAAVAQAAADDARAR